ncbi:hypothetical protein MRB53_016644 [Persea americana]|uniref:Uncharacterized protein n=1 Tax=Persea americana TaxID=3435 RepID=A0ACC2M2T9_PERAE|nr:hypothetical protein MRB53_016644 [Persea americana]
MGGRAPECSMGVQNNSEMLHLSNTILLSLRNGAVIPLEVGPPTLRSKLCNQRLNDINLARELDLAKERRESAAICLAAYQQQLARGYNRKVKERGFSVGEPVLKKMLPGDKPAPNWHRPFKVLSAAGRSAYRLEDIEGKELPRPWNTMHLKKYYF